MELDSIKQFDAQYETDMHTISCCTGLNSQVDKEPSSSSAWACVVIIYENQPPVLRHFHPPPDILCHLRGRTLMLSVLLLPLRGEEIIFNFYYPC